MYCVVVPLNFNAFLEKAKLKDDGATPYVMNVWQSKADNYSIVQCAMLYGLEPGLQRRFERHGAYEMFQELKLIF